MDEITKILNQAGLEEQIYQQIIDSCCCIAIKYIKAEDPATFDYPVPDGWAQCFMDLTREQQVQLGYNLELDIKKNVRVARKPSNFLEEKKEIKKYKIVNGEIIEIGSSSRFNKEYKQFYSKSQAFTLIKIDKDYTKSFLPPIFSWKGLENSPKTGLIFFSKDFNNDPNLLLGNILQGLQVNTFYRSHQFTTEQEARIGFKNKQYGTQIFFNSPEELFEQGNAIYTNEALIRAKFSNDYKTQHGIFEDNLASRILAQFRVIDMKINLNLTFIPISFYKKYNRKNPFIPYLLFEQVRDLKIALKHDDPEIKARAQIINIYNNNDLNFFKNLTISEQTNIIRVIKGTQTTNLMKYKLLYLISNINIDLKYGFLNLNIREKSLFIEQILGQDIWFNSLSLDDDIVKGCLILSLIKIGRKSEDIFNLIKVLNINISEIIIKNNKLYPNKYVFYEIDKFINRFNNTKLQANYVLPRP